MDSKNGSDLGLGEQHPVLRALRAGEGRLHRAHVEFEGVGEDRVRLAGKLDQQDAGQAARGRRASDRGSYSRFAKAVAEADLLVFTNPRFFPLIKNKFCPLELHRVLFT